MALSSEALVALMSQGGELLREREELILEHARLTAQRLGANFQGPIESGVLTMMYLSK